YNIITLFNFVFADAFIGIFIPSIFLILISDDKNKSLYISSMIFVLFFMKSTMFLVTLLCSIFFIFFEKKIKLSKRCGPLFFVCIAYIIWGTFGYIKTGVFTIGFKTMSSSQLALKTTLNKNFHKYYPKKSVDLIPGKHDANTKYKEEWNNEWDMYNHYKKENVEYINNNKTRILNDTLIKVKFIFFNIYKDAVHPDKNGEFKNPFMFSHLFNRIIFLVSIFFCVSSIFRNIIRLNFSKLDYYYIILVSSSILPHLIGWATSKHLVGIFILSHIYLIVKIFEKKLQKYILN
ncbi:hypothetical protein, partial [Candidatus Pelagibacter sp.]|uniref:hypothetical protein n=1 Tax=Candidatus Pelagibacter sp. TaxID=2024849 RepID=UPI003F8575E4